MPIIIAAILLLLGAAITNLGGGFPFGERLLKPLPPSSYEGMVCLDPSQVGTEPLLKDIPKPRLDFPSSPDPSGQSCPSQECPGPETADYLLAASNVKVDKIWPNPPTTRLVRQEIPPDHPQYEQIKDRVYRASCNDWCWLCNDPKERYPCSQSGTLPYGGTFHCDFIWLLQPNQPLAPRGDAGLYPQDGAIFDVLIREGADIPQRIRCPQTGSVKGVFAQTESFINLLGFRWIYVEEVLLLKINLRPANQGREFKGEVFFRGKEYEAYQNLTLKIDPTDDFLYLVLPGIVADADRRQNSYFSFDYLEFRKTTEVKPQAKSLQLGTFKVPLGKGWWRKWIDESKPAIYLYPEKETLVSVKLSPAGILTVSDPPYNGGWENILAHPSGLLTYQGKTYPYLYYEANLEKVYVEPEGFIVAGESLVEFFQNTLPQLGLNEKETQDFLTYWMARLSPNQPYYFIHFLDNDQIEKLEPLKITPAPQTQIRIRAYFQPLEEAVPVEPQILPRPAERKGFTVVEWGGILDGKER